GGAAAHRARGHPSADARRVGVRRPRGRRAVQGAARVLGRAAQALRHGAPPRGRARLPRGSATSRRRGIARVTRLGWTTAGESHGPALVGVLEGLPSGMPLDLDRVNRELARRQGGYGRGGRMRIEKDEIELLSGTRGGRTLGSPISFRILNADATIEK